MNTLIYLMFLSYPKTRTFSMIFIFGNLWILKIILLKIKAVTPTNLVFFFEKNRELPYNI